MNKNFLILGLALLSAALAGPACRSAEGGLPDLYVARLDCQAGNLVLTVGNKGGPLPAGWAAAAAISVDGGPQEIFPLVLPGEAETNSFAKGKGAMEFLTSTRIEDISGISVYLDFSDQIKESDETNNTVENWHIAPCDLPDLVITDLRLDENCNVQVTIKNVGQGPIDEPAWSYEFLDYCGVSIYIDGKEVACVPFLKFDADRRVEPAGGSAVLKSAIRIAKESVVLAVVDSTQVIVESDETNNRASAKLTCPSAGRS